MKAAAAAKTSDEAKAKVKNKKEPALAKEEPKVKGKWIVVKDPSSGSYENKWGARR